jgi:hypothetical protein
VFCGTDFEEFGHGEGDGAHFAEHGDFEEARVDGFSEFGYLFQLIMLH